MPRVWNHPAHYWFHCFSCLATMGSIPSCLLMPLILAGLELKFCDFLDTSVLPSFQTHFCHSITYWVPSLCFLLKSVPTPVSNHCLPSFLVSNTLTPRMPFSQSIVTPLVFFFSHWPYNSSSTISTSMFRLWPLYLPTAPIRQSFNVGSIAPFAFPFSYLSYLQVGKTVF